MTAQPVITPRVQTPILDRVQPLPLPKKRTLWPALAGGLVSGVSVSLVIFPHYSSGPLLHVKAFLLNINPLVFFPLMILMYYAALLVHESGHLLAGLLVGFRVDHMCVGPLLFRPPLRVSLQRRNLYGFAAHAQVVPSSSEGLRHKMLVFVLGGVSANLLSGALAVWLYSQMDQAVFGYYAVLSLLMGVYNLVPFTQRASISDGKRAWMLLFDRPQGDRWLAMIRLSTDMVHGMPPEKCDPQLVRQCSALVDDSPDTVTAHQWAYTVAYFSGNDDEAARCLEISMSHFVLAGPALRESFPFQAAIFQARKRKNVALANDWLSQAPPKTMIPGLRLQAEAAILEAEGRMDEALTKLDQSLAVSSTIKEDAGRQLTVSSLNRWRTELVAKSLLLTQTVVVE